MNQGRGRWLATVVLAGLLIVAFAFSVSFGASSNSWSLWVESDTFLITSVRLPRVTLAALVGAALGACGASLQALLRNPLADPYVLGTSGGAALGGALALISGVAAWGLFYAQFFAFSGALVATLVVFGIGARGASSPTQILLGGIVLNAFAAASITLVKTLLSATQAQELLWWLVGSIGYESWATIGLVSIYIAIGFVVLVALSWSMNLMSLGDEGAAYLGLSVSSVKWAIFFACALMVAAVVSLCGMIGFVGLVVPNGIRLVFGDDHRFVVPLSAIGGALFLVCSDVISRMAFRWVGTEPPVGAITAFIGCPVFLWLLIRRP